jgi:hypothetical protein
MGPVNSLLRLHGIVHSSRTVVVAALILLFVVAVRSAQNPAVPNGGDGSPPDSAVKNPSAPTPPKQVGGAKKDGLEKTKTDVAQLSALADKLRDELNDLNPNIFSLDILQKTQAIEKLAKQIKEDADER